jgi:hypothetical protein
MSFFFFFKILRIKPVINGTNLWITLYNCPVAPRLLKYAEITLAFEGPSSSKVMGH